jgi:hypothetical protein
MWAVTDVPDKVAKLSNLVWQLANNSGKRKRVILSDICMLATHWV